MLLYTFAIHDAERDVPFFSCTANSEAHATAKCRSIGYKDFTLSESRPLTNEESPEFVRRSIAKNPFVGEHWLPAIDAFCIFIESRETDRRQPTWSVDVLALVSPDTVERRCFVQGLVESDGAMHLELSGDMSSGLPFTDEQIEQLEFVGWRRWENFEIFYIEFEPGWIPLYIGERIIEALTSVHGITENDIFAFTFDREVREAIDTRTSMVDITIRERSGVAALHTMPGSAAIDWANNVRNFIEESETESGAPAAKTPEPAPVETDAPVDVHSPPTNSEMEYSKELEEFYGDDSGHQDQIDAAVFRNFENEIVLEVMPRIFLKFSPHRAPEIEDFYFHPKPWLTISAEQFSGDIPRMTFVADKWRDFLTVFASSVYECDGESAPDTIDMDEHSKLACLVARGIYGSAHDHSGEHLIWRAAELVLATGEIEDEMNAAADTGTGTDSDQNFEPQAWLAYVPTFGANGYFRPMSERDLLGWGIPSSVTASLRPLWPSDPHFSYENPASQNALARLNSGYRAIRLGELKMQWADIDDLLPGDFEFDDDNWDVNESSKLTVARRVDLAFAHRDAIVSEAARWLGTSPSAALEWLESGIEMFVDYSKPGPGWVAPQNFFSSGLSRKPTEEEANSVVREVIASIFGGGPRPSTREAVLGEAVVRNVFRLLMSDGEYERRIRPLVEYGAEVEYPLSSAGFYDLGTLNISTAFVGWMAGRVVTVLRMLSTGKSPDECAFFMMPSNAQSVLDEPRLDELLFTTLFCEVLFRLDSSEFEQGFDEAVSRPAMSNFKNLLSATFFRQPVADVFDAVPAFGGGATFTPESIAVLIDTASALSCEVGLKIGQWRIGAIGFSDGVELDITHRDSKFIDMGSTLLTAEKFGFTRAQHRFVKAFSSHEDVHEHSSSRFLGTAHIITRENLLHEAQSLHALLVQIIGRNDFSCDFLASKAAAQVRLRAIVG